MLSHFIFSVNIVMPLFVILFLGYSLKKFSFFNEAFLSVANRLVFYVALPISLFRSISSSDISALMDVPLIIFSVGVTLASFLLIWGISLIFIKDKAVLGAFVQGAFRGNIAFVGLPLLVSLAGDAGMARIAIFITFVTPLYNIFSIILLSVTSNSSEKIKFKTLLFAIIKNPLVVSIFMGIAFVLLDINLPVAVETSVGLVSGMATPLALLCLGANMNFRGFDKNFSFAVVSSIIKVAVLPVVFAIIGFLFGFRGYDLAALMVLGGTPTAISGHAMVIQMGGNEYVSGTIVVLSTLMSLVSITIFIYVMRLLGLI